MEFLNRIKKEMTEGIVRALLEDAGYRVIDSGIEKVIRELSCLSVTQYHNLSYPEAISSLPDFTVMDRDQKEKFLVEVKYRKVWSLALLKEIEDQVRIFKEITLISFNADPPSSKHPESPSLYIRCCKLRHLDGKYEVRLEVRNSIPAWRSVSEINDKGLWFKMSTLQSVFIQLSEREQSNTLTAAINAIKGILN